MPNHILESEHSLPVTRECDVVVAGGGPAGFSAALSAARSGVSVTLIELGGALGGVWTQGLLSYILDAHGKSGILDEIVSELKNVQGYLHTPHPPNGSSYIGDSDWTYDSEAMKFVLEKLAKSANIHIEYHSRVVNAFVKDRLITHVVIENNSGRSAIAAKQFIDATGNGDLGFFAGASYEVGHPQSGEVQPATLVAIISGFPEGMQNTLQGEAKIAMHQKFASYGSELSYRRPVFVRLPHPNLAAVFLNHQYSVSHDDNSGITQATIEAREEVFNAIANIRKDPEWREARVVQTANFIGLREGRRLNGLYKLSVTDLQNGANFEDAICLVHLPVDLHSVNKKDEKAAGEKKETSYNAGLIAKPYQIPARSLISADVDNLMMAGRCVSGDFYAHASYRVTGNSVPMGEAAGFIAAKSVIQKVTPSQYLEQNPGGITAEMANRGYLL